MKAVNLIPVDERRGGATGDSGLAPYIVLGVLALVVALSAAFALANRSVSPRRARERPGTDQDRRRRGRGPEGLLVLR